MPRPGVDALLPVAEDVRQVAHDTNKRVQHVEEHTAPDPAPKRYAKFGIVVLVLYLLTALFVSVRDAGKAVDAAAATQKDLNTTVERLSFNNQTLLIDNQRLNREKVALLAVAAEQSRRLRENGIPSVDPFDPASNGGTVVTRPSPSPGVSSPKPSEGSVSPPRSSPSPAPRPSPSKTPAPRSSPLATICAPGLPCISTPTLPPVPLVQAATYTLQEDPVDPINFLSGDAGNVSRLIALVIPLLVAAITKRGASSGLKGVLNAVASAITGSVSYLVGADGGYNFTGFFNATLNVLVVSMASYYVILKPTGLTDKVDAKTGDFGIGGPSMQTEEATEAVVVPADTVSDGTISAKDITTGSIVDVKPKKRATRRKKP